MAVVKNKTVDGAATFMDKRNLLSYERKRYREIIETRKRRKQMKELKKKKRREKIKSLTTSPIKNEYEKFIETEGYVSGKETGRKRANSISNFFKKQTGSAGRAILGNERFNKYKDKAYIKNKRLKKQIKYAEKHPYRAAGNIAYKGTLSAAKFGIKKGFKVNKIAANKSSAAAKLIVKQDGILALFKPIYWSLRINAIFASHPQPYIIIGLLFFGIFAMWYFGSFSAQFSLYALKSLAIGLANTFFSVGNAIIFGINGILTIVQLGIFAIINQIGYFFTGGIIEIINNVTETLQFLPGVNAANMEFQGIGAGEYYARPPWALAYLVPNATGLGYIWIHPGAQPYQIDEVTDSIIYEPVAIGDDGKMLYVPKVNDYGATAWIVDMQKDRPPPIDYDFTTNPAGYVYDESNDRWVFTGEMFLSKTLFGSAVQLTEIATNDNIFSWLDEGRNYYIKSKNGYRNPTTISVNERSKYFFVAALYEWDDGLLDKDMFNNANPQNWKRSGTMTSFGKTYSFDMYASRAKLYVAKELDAQGYTIEDIREMEKSDYEDLSVNIIYPIYVQFIKEEIEPWFPT